MTKQVVTIEVTEIQRNGIVVKLLENNRLGFIRRRELSWDRRINTTPTIPAVGKQLKAVLLQNEPNNRYAILSLRQLNNPWQETKVGYQPGQIVQGEVVNVRNSAIFVQIESGIDAVIWSKDIPLQKQNQLKDVIAIGDKIEGIITYLDMQKHKMEISVMQWLQQLSQVNYNRLAFQQTFLKRSLELDNTLPSTSLQRYHPPISTPERILVIDNNKTYLKEICNALYNTFKIPVDGVSSGKKAVANIKQGVQYGLAIIDIHLDEEYGNQVAEELLTLQLNLAILFISSNPASEEFIQHIYGQRYPYVNKTTEEIVEKLENLLNGYTEDVSLLENKPHFSNNSFIQQLGMVTLTQQPLLHILRTLLIKLKTEINVSHTLIFEVDHFKKHASIMVAYPPLNQDIVSFSSDLLYYSPVRTVIEEEETCYITHIETEDARLRYFLPLLSFKVCFGIPLIIPNLVTRYALFVLDTTKNSLSKAKQNKIMLSGQFMQVALERDFFLDYMKRYEHRYSHGQLLNSLVHELKNKLDGLEGSLQSLPILLDKITPSTPPDQQQKYLDSAKKVVTNITNRKTELNQLINVYSGMVYTNLEALNVNNIINKIQQQLTTKAKETAVTIYLELDKNLPSAHAIQLQLEQILFNLILNAIQQIEQQAKLMKNITNTNNQNKQNNSLLQQGLILIKTRFNPTQSIYPIQIIITDTGPGIHYHQQDHIFFMDTSARKGMGLGLFISRNLAETMGGRLRLLDSVIFIGSTFVVELPQYIEQELTNDQ